MTLLNPGGIGAQFSRFWCTGAAEYSLLDPFYILNHFPECVDFITDRLAAHKDILQKQKAVFCRTVYRTSRNTSDTVQAIKHEALLREWAGRIAECRSSGMTVKAWCEAQGVSIKRYYYGNVYNLLPCIYKTILISASAIFCASTTVLFFPREMRIVPLAYFSSSCMARKT